MTVGVQFPTILYKLGRDEGAGNRLLSPTDKEEVDAMDWEELMNSLSKEDHHPLHVWPRSQFIVAHAVHRCIKIVLKYLLCGHISAP